MSTQHASSDRDPQLKGLRAGRRRWTVADDALLRVLHEDGLTMEATARRMGRHRSQIKDHAAKLGLRFGDRRPFSAEDDASLRARYENESTADIARDLGRSVDAIYRRAQRLGLHKSPTVIAETARERSSREGHGGRAHRFEKGHVPANKGLRRPGWHRGRMVETQFKPRAPEECRNYRPIGSLRLSKDGYLERKVTDDRNVVPARRWAPVHRLVWEAAHGPVPPGHAIAFKPGRRTAEEALITLDALELVSQAELMRRNSYHNNYPKEIGLAIQARGQLVRKIKRLVRERAEGAPDSQGGTP